MDPLNKSTNAAESATTTMKAPVRLLVDSRPVQLQLIESATPGKVMMRGEFARCGVATENKRVYPTRLWERELRRLGKAMTERQLFGELDHPSDGRTQLTRASHIITNLEIKDGIVVGEAQILDTARGRDLKAILESGARVGISSRGHGSTRMNEKGEDVVQDDYRLMTFDFVADPADQNAFPDVFYESKGQSMDRTDAEMAQEFARQIEAAKKEGRQGAEESLREEFAKEVTSRLGELRKQVSEEVRGELLSDPAVAGAKTALDRIKDVLRPFVLPEDARAVAEQKDAEIAQLKLQLAEQHLKMKTLEEENAQLEGVAKEAGYKYFVERQLGGDPDADLVRKLIGDVTHYTSAEDLKEKISSVRTDLAEKREEARKLSEQIEATETAQQERKEQQRLRALKREKQLSEDNDKLRSALEQSLEANKQLGLQVYAESRLANHPKAPKLRSLIESTNPQSREEVDGILSQFRETARDPDQLEGVRSRVRNLTRGGQGPTAIEEESSPKTRAANGPWDQLGVSLDDIRMLSGMSEADAPSLNRNR